MQYKFVGFVENNFVGKPTFLFSTFGVWVFTQQLVFQPIWRSVYTDDRAVVKQAIQHSVCQCWIFEDLRPFRKCGVGSNDCWFLLVSFCDQLKEQISRFIIHFQIPQFINYEKSVLRILFQSGWKSVFVIGLLQLWNKILKCNEIRWSSCLGCFDSDCRR